MSRKPPTRRAPAGGAGAAARAPAQDGLPSPQALARAAKNLPKLDRDKPVHIAFSQAIRFKVDEQDHEVSEITLSPIRGAIMRHVPSPGLKPDGTPDLTPDYFLRIAAAASGQPPELFDALPYHDMMQVVGVAALLVGPSQGTGGRASRHWQ